MNLANLLTPWIILAAVIAPLVWIERWIHSHLYGVGWLLTNNEKSATALYYVLLSPGVFVHEFTQYLVAGALNVKIKKVIAWPDAQKDGTLRLDFVRIQKANRLQTAILGAVPLIVGLALVWLISSQMLNLDQVVEAIPSGDLDRIGAAMQEAARAPDFLLWLYIIFTISNAMFPTSAERQAWPLLIALFAAVMVFLVLIGVGDVLMDTFTGPVAEAVERLTIAVASVLVAEIPAILMIGFFEEVLEKITKRKFQYNRPQPGRARRSTREPGSNQPLAPGAPFPSIYNLHLPIPTVAEVKAPAPRPRQPAAERSPELTPRPTLEPSANPPVTARPEREARPFEREDAPLSPRAPGTFERPGGPVNDKTLPTARPESPLTRRSQPADQIAAARDERPPVRRTDTPAAQPESPFLRRSAPPADEPAADRFTRTPAASPFRSSSPRDADVEADEPPSGAFRRPSPYGDSSLARRPSPFMDDEDDTGSDEDELAYEDFDDDASVLDDEDYTDLDSIDDE